MYMSDERFDKAAKELARLRTEEEQVIKILGLHVEDGSIDGGVLDDLCDALRITVDDLPDRDELIQEDDAEHRRCLEYLRTHAGVFREQYIKEA